MIGGDDGTRLTHKPGSVFNVFSRTLYPVDGPPCLRCIYTLPLCCAQVPLLQLLLPQVHILPTTATRLPTFFPFLPHLHGGGIELPGLGRKVNRPEWMGRIWQRWSRLEIICTCFSFRLSQSRVLGSMDFSRFSTKVNPKPQVYPGTERRPTLTTSHSCS